MTPWKAILLALLVALLIGNWSRVPDGLNAAILFIAACILLA